MAPVSSRETFMAVLFLSSLCFHAVLGEIVCEDLPKDKCAFAVSASGRRCVLETSASREQYECRTSEVVVERMAGHIESDDCIKACGVDRNSVGISSDSLLEADFTAKLCSSACFDNCPNIVDLYVNLAAGEGAFLPDVCKARRANPRRSMVEILSSGAAQGPVPNESSQDLEGAPAPSPM